MSTKSCGTGTIIADAARTIASLKSKHRTAITLLQPYTARCAPRTSQDKTLEPLHHSSVIYCQHLATAEALASLIPSKVFSDQVGRFQSSEPVFHHHRNHVSSLSFRFLECSAGKLEKDALNRAAALCKDCFNIWLIQHFPTKLIIFSNNLQGSRRLRQ